MISRILVAVDDSLGGLAAARVAIELASTTGAKLHAIVVGSPSADAVLRHIDRLAGRAAVTVQGFRGEGEVGPVVLAQATACSADIVVIGRSRQAHDGQPFVGSQTRLVLEFAAVPVVVVPLNERS